MTSRLSAIKEALITESWKMRSIGKVADASETALSETAATISDQLYDHHLVDAFTQEQELYVASTYILISEAQFWYM